MICSYCWHWTVTWRGPLSALTHTECSNCGGQNCQVVDDESQEETDTEGRKDA